MDIVDIKEVKIGIIPKFEVIFMDESGDDSVKIIMTKDNMWEIAQYCHNKLSYGAELRKNELNWKKNRSK